MSYSSDPSKPTRTRVSADRYHLLTNGPARCSGAAQAMHRVVAGAIGSGWRSLVSGEDGPQHAEALYLLRPEAVRCAASEITAKKSFLISREKVLTTKAEGRAEKPCQNDLFLAWGRE